MSFLNVPGLLMLLTPPAGAEYSALIPAIIVGVVSLVVILLDVFHRTETSRGYLGYLAAVGLGVAMVACWGLWDDSLTAPTFHGMVYLDKFGLFFAALCSACGAAACLLAPRYLQIHNMDRGEYYMLVLLSVLGMIFMANAADLLAVFVALELMSIPVYVLAAFLRKDRRSAEAGMKYFVLGAFSAAILLYGIALVYGVTGTTNLEYIATNVATLAADPAAIQGAGFTLVFGVLLILSGFAFKVAAVPFHIWTPDVYTGSPTPAVGFMATGVKAAAFAGLLRVFILAFFADMLRGGFMGLGWVDVLAFVAAASMVLGNFAAIVQTNVKRMLAYSSIAHAGYILVGVVAANASPRYFLYNDTVLFYLVAYTFGTIGAFGVLGYLGRHGRSAETYDDLSGLGFKYPMLGLIMSICMFSSAGIPPTAGFLGKLYVFRAAVDVGQSTGEGLFIALAVLGVLTSVAGVYYYLRVLVCMYMREEKEVSMEALEHSGAKAALIASALLVLYIGILPGRTVDLAREAVVDLQGAPEAVQPAIAKGRAALEERLVGQPADDRAAEAVE
jgi:NADH-quinone oxidoreductase subunit N